MAGEISQGSPSPLVQPPEPTVQPLTLPPGLQNPDANFPPPLPGLPAADLSTPIARPATLLLSEQPSSASGVSGGDLGFNIPQSSIGLPSGQSAQQANQVELIAFPVLSRLGPQATSWAAPLTFPAAGKTVTFRGTYRDMHVTPGFRGIQLQYNSSVGAISIRHNTTGQIYTLPPGPQTIFLPLFMLREVYDLTISCSTAFGTGITGLLTTEEQLPFIVPQDGIAIGTQVQSNSGNVANASATTTFVAVAGRTYYVTRLTFSAAGSTAGSVVNATLTGVNNNGVTSTLSWQFTFQASPLLPTVLDLAFNPPLQEAPGTNMAATLPAGGAGNTNAEATMIGFYL